MRYLSLCTLALVFLGVLAVSPNLYAQESRQQGACEVDADCEATQICRCARHFIRIAAACDELGGQ
jgi:hypothetical protein